MGSRRGSSARDILGSGKGSSRSQANLKKKLENASAKAVAEATFETLAKTDATVGALYLAYRVAKFTYPIVKAGAEEYEKSHDSEKAIDKMKVETVKQVGAEIRGQVISAIVDRSVDVVKDTAKITVNAAADTFVKSAISGTIDGMIGK